MVVQRNRARWSRTLCQVSGEWNDEALRIMATKPFVVFEKNHKVRILHERARIATVARARLHTTLQVFEDPVNNEAEAKIVESCRKLKAINSTVQCLM